jgi:hypothetical protein
MLGVQLMLFPSPDSSLHPKMIYAFLLFGRMVTGAAVPAFVGTRVHEVQAALAPGRSFQVRLLI